MELLTSCAAFLRRGAVDEVARHARVRAVRPMRLPGQLRAAHRLVDVGEDVHVLCLQVNAGQRRRKGAVEILEQVGAFVTRPLFLGLCRAARDAADNGIAVAWRVRASQAGVGKRVLGCVWRGKRERTVPLDTEIDRRTVAPRRDARDGGRVTRGVRTCRLIDGNPVHGRRRPRPRHLVSRHDTAQVGHEAGGAATGEPFVIGWTVGVRRKSGHVEGVARVVDAGARVRRTGRLGRHPCTPWHSCSLLRQTRCNRTEAPDGKHDFHRPPCCTRVFLCVACVKVEAKNTSAMAGTTSKRGAKGPNSLVNRRALPVASPMGWP
eukprot:scaffold19910_cov70-Phaeocystis_antarctica.AAC.6